MIKLKLCVTAVAVSLLAGTSCVSTVGPTVAEVAAYEDLADRSTNKYNAGQVYRMGRTGICGTVAKDHILVTHVIPGSKAHGKIMKGDRVVGMQHRGMAGFGGTRGLVGVRLYRIGRDWDWHFFVTVERQSLRGGKGNTVTYDLHMPPDPGNLCHYGPTGFFAKRYSDHLVVDIVEKGSPSAGKLQKGDVIVAVDGQPISVDAYNQFTKAIDKAESKSGKLPLMIKRPGKDGEKAGDKTSSVNPEPLNPEPLNPEPISITLQLKVLGEYSETAPIKCAKTDALITQTADYLVKHGSKGVLHTWLLALMATGEQKYIDVVGAHVRGWARPFQDPKYSIASGGTSGYVSWHWGYRNLVMTEYYLLTKDAYVLPAIRDYSRTMAAGQDAAGLWGHRMCHPELRRSYGYGVMNQPSISIFISLILAQKCGINDPVVDAAVKRTHDHYNKWVGQGALPYGNHCPMEHQFTNGGTSGSLAIAFAQLGNKEGARFYATMSAAASKEVLLGHGGPWWNILWSGLGTSILGPELVSAYDKEVHWLRTVTRCWDGRYVDIAGWGSNPQSKQLSDTANRLLTLCSGRRALHVTGKGMDKSLWVTAAEAKAIIKASEIDTSSETALLESLGGPLPPVRVLAAQGLAMLDARVDDKVMALLTKGTLHQRIGAIRAIQNLKIEGAEDELLGIAVNEKEDLWLRQQAVKELANMKAAKTYAPQLLKVLAQDKPYDEPYRELDLALGGALVKLYQPDPYATDLDKELFYKGVAKLLDHKHVAGRACGMNLIKNIPMEDLPRMIDKMVYVVEDKDNTYTSYNGAGRQEALEALYRLGIKESMDYTVNTIQEPTGRGGPRKRARIRLLNTFGAEAKYLIPRLKEVLGAQADPIIKQIEESETAKKMITVDELKRKSE